MKRRFPPFPRHARSYHQHGLQAVAAKPTRKFPQNPSDESSDVSASKEKTRDLQVGLEAHKFHDAVPLHDKSHLVGKVPESDFKEGLQSQPLPVVGTAILPVAVVTMQEKLAKEFALFENFGVGIQQEAKPMIRS